MILIDDTVISDDIVEKNFVCDLQKCKGACCVEGDLGAPLEESELKVLDEIFEKVKPYLSAQGVEEIEKQGKYVYDEDYDYSTPTINGKECAYAVYDKDGILSCGIELAYKDEKIDFIKPISCHLYPIRISKFDNYFALNYDRWSICSDACVLGDSLKVPVYKFLKTPLIRAFGQTWYDELDMEAREK